MKIRTSFVSNSSTASFIFIGVEIPETAFTKKIMKALLVEKKIDFEDDEIEDVFMEAAMDEQLSLDFKVDTEQGAPRGKYLVGKNIATIHDDDELTDGAVSLTEINKVAEEVKTKLGIDKEPKVYYGTMMC